MALLSGSVLRVLFAGYQVINTMIDNVIGRRYIGGQMKIWPLLSFLSVLFGAWVLGPIGAILSVPLTVLMRRTTGDQPPLWEAGGAVALVDPQTIKMGSPMGACPGGVGPPRRMDGVSRTRWMSRRGGAGGAGLLLLLSVGVVSSACSQEARLERGEYVASSRGRVYYWVGCEAWRSLAPENLRWFASAVAAERAGYTPSRSRACAGPGGGEERSGTISDVCTVARVVDGDTISCVEGDERLRLLLIDAPEMAQGEYGDAARDALAELIPVGTVTRITRDVQERDRYTRLLAYVYAPDGRMVNEEMVRLGYAVVSVYPPNVLHVDRLRAAADEARRLRRGLWSGTAFECTPADFRRDACP